MFERLIDWFRGNDYLDFWGEKQTPKTDEVEPLPQPEVEKPKESFLDKKRREQAEREAIHVKELQQKVDEIILTEEEFNIGDQVQYTKVPNDNVEFYVCGYRHSYVCNYHYVHIYPGYVTVQYFDANQILQTIKDEIKWFKKV